MSSESGIVTVYRDLSGAPSDDLAFEGDLLDRAGHGATGLLVYSWQEPVVVLGYGQPPEDVDLDWCRDQGVPVFRRLTGGTGVVHCRDLAISLAVPESHPWAKGIVAMYGRFLEALAAGLRRVGGRVKVKKDPVRPGSRRSPICFEDQQAETLLVGGRKVVGCAQARRRGGVLIHAAVALNLQPDLYAGAFRSTEEKVSRGLADAVSKVEVATVAEAVIDEILEAVQARKTEVGSVEASAEMLDRYTDDRWAPLRCTSAR